MDIAVLLTCHNRIHKTDKCLSSFYEAINDVKDTFDIYLVDDGSTDGTSELIAEKYPQVNLIKGSGSLFWAGGMRTAWKSAIDTNRNYDGFLLINDDVEFISGFWTTILETLSYSDKMSGCECLCVSSTKDKATDVPTYGGHCFIKKLFKHRCTLVEPKPTPQRCDVANANILYVPESVVDKIGILDAHFTHSLADFDYTITANEQQIPVYVTPGFGGFCQNDHDFDQLSESIPFNKRLKNLYSVKGIALNEYIYYLRKHFWWKAFYAFPVLWMRVLFPKWIK